MSTISESPTTTTREALELQLGRRLIAPEDNRYDAARAVWNGMVNKRPRWIARCAGAEDIAVAVREATKAGLSISIRCGGHQIAGGAIIEDGVVIDLSAMRQVDVDVSTKTATVCGGALLGDLDRAVTRYGLAVPAGVVSHTGVGGLTVGGGQGWLSRKRGLTIDSLIGATVVDGTGRTLHVDEKTHPDLFWAIRGGGGNFGVVAEFVFTAAPIGRIVFGTRIVGLDQARDALLEYGRRAPNLPREIQVMVKLQKLPSPRGSGERDSAPVVTFEWLWSGALDEADKARQLLGLDEFGTFEESRQWFAEVQSQQDHRYPHGYQYYLKPGFLNDMAEVQVDAVLAAADTMPDGDMQIELLLLGGAIRDVDEAATAYPSRTAGYAFNVTAGWPDPKDSESHIGWTRATHEALHRLGPGGGYINFLGADKLDLTEVFGAEKLARLRQVKRDYDPNDEFRPSVHIEPAEE